jgi:hypothetical protein
MEIPDLSLSSVWCLDNHVSVVDQVEVSAVWKFGDNVEVSLYIESESFIELSLLWLSLPLVSVDNVPLLVDFSVFWMDNDVSVFRVNSS